MITLLNSSIVTNFGTFTHTPLSLDEAKALLTNGFTSAIGHQSTADVLTELLEVKVDANRITYQQKVGDTAIIFKLNKRAPEGKILTKLEIYDLGFSFSKLEMIG